MTNRQRLLHHGITTTYNLNNPNKHNNADIESNPDNNKITQNTLITVIVIQPKQPDYPSNSNNSDNSNSIKLTIITEVILTTISSRIAFYNHNKAYNLSNTANYTITLKPFIAIEHYNLDNRNARNYSNKITSCVASTHSQVRSPRKPSE
jgi:hypothetical protein